MLDTDSNDLYIYIYTSEWHKQNVNTGKEENLFSAFNIYLVFYLYSEVEIYKQWIENDIALNFF